jgi:hypothetical protein
MAAYVSIRQHTSAYVSIRQHTSAYVRVSWGIEASAASKGAESKVAKSRSGWLQVAYVSIRQHTSAYVRIRQHTPAYVRVSIRQHTPAYVSIRQTCGRQCDRRCGQHMSESAYASIRQHASAYARPAGGSATDAAARGVINSCRFSHSLTAFSPRVPGNSFLRSAFNVSIRQHTSAYVSIRQHTSGPRKQLPEVRFQRQHTAAYVSIRQHTSAYVGSPETAS